VKNIEVQKAYQDFKDFIQHKTNSFINKGMLKIVTKILKNYE